MTHELPFDFNVDKASKKVFISMEFDAPPEMVWDAFTRAEILDQWYAPKPFSSRTKYMNFEVGGKRFYAMVSPEGQERWALQTYTSITPKTNFKMHNVFTDKDENPDPHGSEWNLDFSASPGNTPATTVHISIYNESMERLEGLLEGFKTGFKMTYDNLRELLATLSQR